MHNRVHEAEHHSALQKATRQVNEQGKRIDQFNNTVESNGRSPSVGWIQPPGKPHEKRQI